MSALSSVVPDQTKAAYTLIQISDTHLMDQADSAFVHINPEESFHAVLEDIQQRHANLDLLIHTGDLAQVPVPATYQRYLKTLAKFGWPHYQIPGNHDQAEHFPFHQGKNIAHIVHLGAWSIILLNSAVKDRVDGQVSAQQLQQLEQLLQQFPQQHIIIACHHHPLEMQSIWIDQHKLKNSSALQDILQRYAQVKVVLFGHVHQASAQQHQGIHYLSTPSTSIQFKPQSDNFALDQIAPGYRVLQLYENGKFDSHIQRLEHYDVTIKTDISGY